MSWRLVRYCQGSLVPLLMMGTIILLSVQWEEGDGTTSGRGPYH